MSTTPEQVQELRKTLRAKRTRNTNGNTEQSGTYNQTTGNSGGNSERNTSDEPSEDGYGLQPLSGPGSAASVSERQSNNNVERAGSGIGSLAQGYYGVRSATRRHGEDNGQSGPDGGSVSAGSQTTTGERRTKRIGNLMTEESIPTRNFENVKNKEGITTDAGFKPLSEKGTATVSNSATGKTIKKRVKDTQGSEEPTKIINFETRSREIGEGAKEKVSEFLKTGSVFSVSEAKALKEDFTQVLKDWSRYVDQYLWSREEYSAQEPIWSDMDTDELDLLSRVILKRAQKSTIVARAVRTAVGSNDYILLTTMMVPRVMKTTTLMNKTKKPKTRKQK
jgi:hypothetical protein